nr:glutaminase A [uncultured Rhodoferax sp.]
MRQSVIKEKEDCHDAVSMAMYLIYQRALSVTEGALADYIPELAGVQPDQFGMALMTVGGRLYEIGDTQTEFTIQSVSKVFSYCMALEALGREQVMARVGVEPSGDAFNSIEFDSVTRRPYNPMVTAGAITVAGMLRDAYGPDSVEKALATVLHRFSLAAGRELAVDEAVYRSEAATGHRNRAIAHLLCGSGVLQEPVETALDLYFRLCSIRVTARDLAMMGATLAHMGQNPVTDIEVFDIAAVRETLSVMFSCGMYDYSGSWICDVGVPAKSGVGGGVVGVVNRQLGVGTFAPRLDAKGNSVQGVYALSTLANELGLHAFDCTNTGSSFVEKLIQS